MRKSAILFLPLLLLACAEGTEPDALTAEGDEPYNMIDPVPAPLPGPGDGDRAGAWRKTAEDGRAGLLFAPADGEPIFGMFCDTPGGLVLERHGLMPSGEIGMMSLSAGASRQMLAINPVSDGDPVLRAIVPFNDPLLARLREAPVDVTVAIGEGEPLTLPASPLVPELVAACAGEEAEDPDV